MQKSWRRTLSPPVVCLQDEVVAVAEKAVLQISDLLDWIADPKEISWDRGLLGFANADCEPQPGDKTATNGDSSNDNGGGSGGVINPIYQPGHTDFLADVRYRISC